MKKHREEEVWLTCEELGRLEGQHATSIRWRVRNGKYRSARKSQRFGDGIKGRQWFISLYDMRVSSRAREKYFIQKTMKDFLRTEIKNVYEKLRKRRFMEMTVREFFKRLSEDMFL